MAILLTDGYCLNGKIPTCENPVLMAVHVLPLFADLYNPHAFEERELPM
jgi:hypothetical protein